MLRLRGLFPLADANGFRSSGGVLFCRAILVACVSVMRVRLGVAVTALGAFAAIMAEVVGVLPAIGANKNLKRLQPDQVPTELDGLIFGTER
jgi:hypothetical protein